MTPSDADKLDIAETVIRVANLADAQDWKNLRDCFLDEVEVDYTSLAGGEPSTVKADDLIAGWRGTLSGFDATHHQVTNILVTLDGDEAHVNAYIHADHYLEGAPGGDHWLVLGTYDYHLIRTGDGWRVSASKLNVKRLEGNNDLADAATERAKRTNV